jgi:hypothetical protein
LDEIVKIELVKEKPMAEIATRPLKNMTYNVAAEHARKGMIIRRNSWTNGFYARYFGNGNSIFIVGEGVPLQLSQEDMDATDWEEYNPYGVVSIPDGPSVQKDTHIVQEERSPDTTFPTAVLLMEQGKKMRRASWGRFMYAMINGYDVLCECMHGRFELGIEDYKARDWEIYNDVETFDFMTALDKMNDGYKVSRRVYGKHDYICHVGMDGGGWRYAKFRAGTTIDEPVILSPDLVDATDWYVWRK